MVASGRRGVCEVESLGSYHLIAELGHGGMARVYLALKQGSFGVEKLVVIKRMHPELAGDDEIREMFMDEARLAARLNHPNIVQTNEVVDDDGCYMVMEYIEGLPLSQILRRLRLAGGLPLSMHLRVLADALAGLHHAHELTDYDGTLLGVVHRDATPQNVLVTYGGVVKVVDFGIAKARISSCHTRAGTVKGKVAYMAPEQALGEAVDRRVDVFAAGVMLWEAVTGERPWKDLGDFEIMKQLVADRFPAARSVTPQIPRELEAIIQKALSHDRRERYASTAEMQAAIEAYLDARGERADRRDIGKLVAAHFEDVRAGIQELVEQRMRGLRAGPRPPPPEPAAQGGTASYRPTPVTAPCIDRRDVRAGSSAVTEAPTSPRRVRAAPAPPVALICAAVLGALAVTIALITTPWAAQRRAPRPSPRERETLAAPTVLAASAPGPVQIEGAPSPAPPPPDLASRPEPETTARSSSDRPRPRAQRRLDPENPYLR